ncbi:Calmodulin-2 [Symbiodinium microadriaticum]|uniref:Calmodulin-2 n=1 Tax=Symbiodinium microadriaticum TaxID=2951 RepID=A0A1Q9CL63_SYMMI|nr:Calmodulin-2 [Symbiodinium microadriaticum]
MEVQAEALSLDVEALEISITAWEEGSLFCLPLRLRRLLVRLFKGTPANEGKFQGKDRQECWSELQGTGPTPHVTAEWVTAALAIAAMALAVMGASSKAPASSGASKVTKAPKMDSKKAFEIPGLQARPYHDDELQVAFEIIDLDRHGEIGSADIRRALQLCGESEPTDAEIQEMIRLMDPDGSGSIEFPEFRRYFFDPPPLFRNFDLHRRGGGERDLEEEVGEGEPLPALEDISGEDQTPEGVQRSDRKKKFTIKAAEETGDPRFKHIKSLIKGGITPDIIRHIYQSFVELDDSDSGYMSFQAFCKVFGKEPSADMREIFDAFDAEHEGELDLRQFVIGLST